ncbi:hypothetical protein UJ101_00347 [Flavobacteriaceae bacterium UJ101]|nr:hypothetical protein UJ101_00347 [Flavobacteriaceae bacterium UJ101]
MNKFLIISFILLGITSCNKEKNSEVKEIKEIPCEIFYDPDNFFHREIKERTPLYVNLEKVGNYLLNCEGVVLSKDLNKENNLVFNELKFMNDTEIHFKYSYKIEGMIAYGILMLDEESGIWKVKKYEWEERTVKR